MNDIFLSITAIATTLADTTSSVPVEEILPSYTETDLSTIVKDGLEFFQLWIGRIGGIVAFIGAVKFGLAVQSEDSREQFQAILTMVSGFMIQSAIGNLGVFNIPSTYTPETAKLEFQSILNFIGGWTRKVGALGMLIGSIMFGFSIKDNNATAKVTGLKTISAGAIVVATSAMLSSFV